MGQARNRKLAGDYPAKITTATPDLAMVRQCAEAVARVMKSTSPARGMDCVLTANTLTAVLNGKGIQARSAIGYAGWRVGSGDGDVVMHAPGVVSGCGGDFAGHAWVEVGNCIVDATAWQLPHKLAMLDGVDGRKSTFQVNDQVLIIDCKRLSSPALYPQLFHPELSKPRAKPMHNICRLV